MADLSRRSFLAAVAVVLGLVPQARRPKKHSGFGTGGFGVSPFGS